MSTKGADASSTSAPDREQWVPCRDGAFTGERCLTHCWEEESLTLSGTIIAFVPQRLFLILTAHRERPWTEFSETKGASRTRRSESSDRPSSGGRARTSRLTNRARNPRTVFLRTAQQFKKRKSPSAPNIPPRPLDDHPAISARRADNPFLFPESTSFPERLLQGC